MKVFIDYDNVHQGHRAKGLPYVAERIISAWDTKLSLSVSSVTLRLYGGWYREEQLSRSGQMVAADISSYFPLPIAVKNRSHPILVKAEQAFSLEDVPHERLHYTFREKSPQHNLRILDDSEINCSTSDCPRDNLRRFIKRSECSAADCTASERRLVVRAEQKLVDTMMAIDLVSYAAGQDVVPVLSADHDLWPPILHLLVRGCEVLHFVPNGRTSFEDNFRPSRFPTYTMIEL